ncbi:nitrogen fixation/metabolism regulation signal transduction histidine kinase [Salsuginibacillus halophilus]|uniref:histidine kinase n=1 Tax=Salsuginibacillus halophilus TaxID=517424 RepID=A0A2P8HFX4_9BACI|nr:ATP-binding protein [Salsuginibacillus halophilus]PSL45100.1 nitrogen fixation/metabolism regulation signal transduction histidine kinase [Salsuginibacillus halophilus]
MDTLRTKLFFIMLIIALAPLGVAGFISYQAQKSELTEQMEDTMVIFSDNAAVTLEDLIQERLSDTELLAANPVLSDETSDPEDIEQEFKNFQTTHEYYFGSIFTNPEGTIVASDYQHVNHSSTQSMDRRQWFEDVQEEGLILSDIFLSDIINQPVIVFAALVENSDGEVVGSVSNGYDMNAMQVHIANFQSQQEEFGYDGDVFLINEAGEYIVHPDPDQVFESGALEEISLASGELQEVSSSDELVYNREEEILTSLAKVSHMEGFDRDWYLGFSVPEDELYAPLQEMLFKYVLLFGVVTLLTVIAAAKLSRYIVRPVERLASATSDFAVGRKVFPLSSDSYEEVNNLTRTFNYMTQKLEERENAHKKSTTILETTDNGVLAFEHQTHHLTTINRKSRELFHIDAEANTKKTVEELMRKNHHFAAFISAVFPNDLMQLPEKPHFEISCTLSGEKRWFLVSVSALPLIENQQNQDILLVFNDITDKRQMENELLRAEKLKLIGQLAAGFAHEIRNPLATIHGFMQLMRRRGHESALTSEQKEVIVKEIDRVNGIVEELLNIARPESEEEVRAVSVQNLAHELDILYTDAFQEAGMKFNIEFPEDELYVEAHEKKLKQICVNVIHNAKEAMTSGGQLLLTVQRQASGEISLLFQDTGEGMDEETKELAGTPFFTTKERGTGLGMMICHHLLEGMNGSMNVKSEQGKGTTIIIHLPEASNELDVHKS